MNIPQPIIDAIVHELAKIPVELAEGIVSLVKQVAASPDPKDTLARALQVTAHDKGADALLDAAFEAKKHVPGSGV